MKVNTTRFGLVDVADSDIIHFADGLLGFESLKKFFIVDPADETLILWLQSAEKAEVAFPILEPKLFKADYKVRLSGNELRALQIDSTRGRDTLVYCILTIPQDVTTMTANLKAPVVINIAAQVARQVVLQENEYSVKCPVYKDLVAVMMSTATTSASSDSSKADAIASAVSLRGVISHVEVLAL